MTQPDAPRTEAGKALLDRMVFAGWPESAGKHIAQVEAEAAQDERQRIRTIVTKLVDAIDADDKANIHGWSRALLALTPEPSDA